MSYWGRRAYYSEMVDRPTCVYRFYDINDELMYVGISLNLEGRLSKHRRREWWPDVDRIQVDWFDGREAAKAAERDAIHHESPLYNLSRPRMECC